MAKQYFVKRKAKVAGPFSKEQLQTLSLSISDHLATTPTGPWETIKSIKRRFQNRASKLKQTDAAFLFPKDLATSNLPEAAVQLLKQFVGKGTLCQWAPEGIFQFPVPKDVVKFSRDGTYAFFSDSATGVPVKELVIAKEP